MALEPLYPNPTVATVNLGTLTLPTDAITAIGTLQTKVNVLLAELRLAGIIAP